jgi:hypothetical protein
VPRHVVVVQPEIIDEVAERRHRSVRTMKHNDKRTRDGHRLELAARMPSGRRRVEAQRFSAPPATPSLDE